MRKVRVLLFFALSVCVAPLTGFSFVTGGENGSVVPPSGGMSKELFSESLGKIDSALRKGAIDAVREGTTYDFLFSVTNATYQDMILPYTKKWIDPYGDVFPEVFLLHSLAAGEMSCVSSKYASLTNLVSRNCARWALMVNNAPLMEDPVEARQGTYFEVDLELWPHIPAKLYDAKKFSKPVFLTRRGWRKFWYLGVGGSSVVVRNDKVPVPWGCNFYPDMRNFPFVAPDKWMRETYHELINPLPRSSSSSFFNVHSGNAYSTTGVIDWIRRNRVWNFFTRVYSPFEFLGGQPIASIASAPDEISGRVLFLNRLLVQPPAFFEEECSIKFFHDPNVEQDLIISPPVNFSLVKEGAGRSIEFSWDGAILDPTNSSGSEFPPNGWGKYSLILIRRWVLKWVGILGILFLSVFFLKNIFNKIRGKEKGTSPRN